MRIRSGLFVVSELGRVAAPSRLACRPWGPASSPTPLGEGLFSPVALLDHADPAVRLWTASHIAEIDNQRARETLNEITALGGLFGFEATIVLKQLDGEMPGRTRRK